MDKGTKIFAFVVVTIGALFGLYIAMSGEKGGAAPVASLSAPVKTGIAPSGIVGELAASVAALMVVYPQELNPVIDQAFAFRERVVNTKIWKSGIGDQVSSAAQAQAQGALSDSAEQKELTFAEVQRFFKEDWPEFRELAVAFGSNPTDLGNGLKIPPAFVAANLASSKFADKLRAALAAESPLVRESPQSRLEISRVDDQHFNINITFPQGGPAITGELEISGSQLALTMLGKRADFTAGDGPRLHTTTAWSAAQVAFMPKSLALFWGDYQAFMAAIKTLIGTVTASDPNMTDDAKEKLNQYFSQGMAGAVQLMAGSWSVERGSVLRSCTQFAADSPVQGVYKGYVDAHQKIVSDGGTALVKLLSPDTFLGVEVSGALLRLGRELLPIMYPQSVIDEITKDQDLKPIVDALGAFSTLAQSYELRGLTFHGVLGDSSFEPGFSLVLSHGKGDGAAMLKELYGTLKDVAVSPSGEPLLSLAEAPEVVLTVTAKPGNKLEGRVAEAGKIVFASSEGMQQSTNAALKGENSAMQKATLAGRALVGELQNSEVALIFSDKPLLSVAKGLAGMFLGPQLQGGGMTPQDLDEVVDLLTFAFASTQRSSLQDNGMVCTDQVSGLVSAGA